MTEQINLIYGGKPEDFRWAGFGSGSGTNLRECAKIIKPALIFSDRPKAKLLTLEAIADVPKIAINGFEACGSWKESQGKPEKEAEYRRKSIIYNEQIVEELKKFEKEKGELHLIVLGGYMRFVMDPLLSAYKDRAINVHPADLTILNYENGSFKRAFVGENAVYDALKKRQTDTRSDVIIVDGREDHGEIITNGPEVRVWYEFLRGKDAEREECLGDLAKAHQGFQKVRSDWPALTTALKMISEARVGLGTEPAHYNEWRNVYVDGKAMPYGGFEAKGK